MSKVSILIISLLFGQFLAGCAYKPDVQQGNTFDDKQLSQLKIGQTKQQVTFIMGTPLLKDTFHKERWDYVYTFAKGYEKAKRKLLTLYFKNDKLSKVDDSQIKNTTLRLTIIPITITLLFRIFFLCTFTPRLFWIGNQRAINFNSIFIS